jgi:peptide/nickel transport system substrate-binding protein
MMNSRIDDLLEQFRKGDLSRRSFVRRATAMGLSAAAAGALVQNAGAQTPGASPAAGGGAAVKGEYVEKADYNALLSETYTWEEPGQTGGQVIYGQTTDIQTLNPTLTSDTYSSQVCGVIFEGLFAVSVIDGALVNSGLAESWTVSEDGLEYVFTLRQGVTWHDGTPFTSADVIATYDGILAEGSLNQYVASITAVLDSYEAPDEYTVIFRAKEPVRTFLLDAAGQSIVPAHIWGSVPAADWPTHPGSTGQDPTQVVGTGPFKFVEWVPGDHITLVRNETYWDTEEIPVIDTFTYRVLPEASAATQALVTGEIDLLESVPPAQAETLAQDPNLNIQSWDTFRFNWFSLNQDASKNTKFVDVGVRQAMMYALDRQLMAEQIYFGFAIQADGTQPVLSFAYSPPEEINTIYNYDPDTARAKLAEAGWVDSDGDGIVEKDGQKLSFEVYFSEGVAQYEQQLPYMQQAWREVGIEAFPSAVPFPTLSDSADAGTFDCVVWGFSWDVTASQEAVFGTEFAPPAGFNVMRYSNPAYDELVPQEKTALVREEARAILVELANIANDDAAAGILLFRQDINGQRRTLHNFYPNGYGLLWSLNRAWTEVQ